MTTTARTIIKGALKDIGVLIAGEDPAAVDATDALESLNQMLAGWEISGIDYQHAPMSLDDALMLDDAHALTVRLKLAEALAALYGRPISPELRRRIDDAWSATCAALLIQVGSCVDDGLLRMPSQYWGWGRGRER